MTALDPALHRFLGGITACLDPITRFRAAMGVEPREFQRQLLTSTASHICCMSSRQLGKSTSIACLAWDAFLRGQVVVCIAPTEKCQRRRKNLPLGRSKSRPLAPRLGS